MPEKFVVPQFIDNEDKILGPITVRQFLILLVATFVIFIECFDPTFPAVKQEFYYFILVNAYLFETADQPVHIHVRSALGGIIC